MEAKKRKIFGRLENRILRPQEQIADEVRRYVRVRGKEKKDGGRPMWLDLRLALDIGFRGRQKRNERNKYPARPALPSGGGGCAAHVPPRCRGGEKA